MARKPRNTAPAPPAEEDLDPDAVSPRAPALEGFGELVKRMKAFRPAREVLTRVRAMPTIFPWLDHAFRVGGWPVERVGLVHGPSNHGKTVVVHGIGLSFLRRAGIYAFVDAEMTTPITWLETLYGPYADSNAFVAMRPDSFEQTVDAVKQLAEETAELRDRGKVPEHTTVVFAVDSIRKLVPKNLMKRIDEFGADSAKGSVDGYGGSAGRYRAQLTAAWMDTLVPLMYRTRSAMVLIARESEDASATPQDKKFGQDYVVGGGKAPYYESSSVIRVVRAANVYVGGTKDAATGRTTGGTMVGEKIGIAVTKTKVSARTETVTKAYVYTSNGQEPGVPEGFDRARDVFELAKELGVLKASGGWWGGRGFRANGEQNALRKLREGALEEVERMCREKSAEVAVAHDVVAPPDEVLEVEEE